MSELTEIVTAVLGIFGSASVLLSAEILRRQARVERTLDTLPCRAALPLSNPDKTPAACVTTHIDAQPDNAHGGDE